MIPLRDTIPSMRFPAVTIGLIVVNAFVFLFELGASTRGLDAVFYQWGIVPCTFTGTCPASPTHPWRFPASAAASKLPHLAVVDVSAWWLDAHHREHVVPLDLWR